MYKIEYNLFQSNDRVTFFISDQRIEVNNHRGYHQIYKSPYLFNLNGQNVTCNCFDTRCYAGVKPDYDVFFSINRVIGGTYRPGVGLCGAKVTWLKCGGNFKRSSNLIYSDDVRLETSTRFSVQNSTENESNTDTLETETTTVETTMTQETTSEATTSIPIPEETTASTQFTTENLFTSTDVLEETEENENSSEETEILDNLNLTTSINILDLIRNSSFEIFNKFKDNDSEEELDDEEDIELQTQENMVDIEEDERILINETQVNHFEKNQPLLIKQNVTEVEPIPSHTENAQDIDGIFFKN